MIPLATLTGLATGCTLWLHATGLYVPAAFAAAFTAIFATAWKRACDREAVS